MRAELEKRGLTTSVRVQNTAQGMTISIGLRSAQRLTETQKQNSLNLLKELVGLKQWFNWLLPAECTIGLLSAKMVYEDLAVGVEAWRFYKWFQQVDTLLRTELQTETHS